MKPYEIVLLTVLGLFVLLVAVLVIRALLFKDKTVYNRETNFTYEEDDIVSKLGKFISFSPFY